jgi:hypothetical protein
VAKDAIDDMFGKLDEFYPGSKRKRRAVEKPVKEKLDKDNWEVKPVIKKLPNGKTLELYSAGAFAAALGRPLVTVRLWERKGYIPKAPYRLKSMMVDGKKKPGWRMYSRAMIESSLQSFQSRGLLEAPRIDWNRHRDLSIELVETWTKIHANETANGNGNGNDN